MKSLDEVIDYCEGKQACGEWVGIADALHYLRAYKEDRNDLCALRAYWAEQQGNPPLTWGELREMVGKPVWVVEEGYQTWEYWSLVYWMKDDELTLLNENGQTTYLKNEQGTVWQAYRKERE